MKSLKQTLLLMLAALSFTLPTRAGDDGFFPLGLPGQKWCSLEKDFVLTFKSVRRSHGTLKILLSTNHERTSWIEGNVVRVQDEHNMIARLVERNGRRWIAFLQMDSDKILHLELVNGETRMQVDLVRDCD